MQTRIYKVMVLKTPERSAQTTRLVEATSAAQAIRHVAVSEYAAHVATTKDVAACMQAGILVEEANAPTAKWVPEEEVQPQPEMLHGV